jgi:hypothetical protein
MDGSTPHPFFIDHVHQRTQTLDPRPLPTGWEQMVTQDGWAYFVDHNAKHSYWTHPCSYPLPGPNWQIMYDDDDQLYFIDHDTRKVCLELHVLTLWRPALLLTREPKRAKHSPTAHGTLHTRHSHPDVRRTPTRFIHRSCGHSWPRWHPGSAASNAARRGNI